jgi:hypothetical protein
MRYLIVALSMLAGSVSQAHAQVSVGIGFPGIDIGINVPVYPELVLVPGYPVYYDPRANSNYFFYDGAYWVYQGDNWYASSWYDGPWQLVGPEVVPLFVLRVPVRYYRQPPPYFRGWRADAPPRWGEHWGRDWEQRRGGWDRWDRRSVPRAAPLPVYQRQYSGDRYPRAGEQQHSIRSEHYRYQPREAVTRQHLQQRGEQGSARADRQRQAPAQRRSSPQRGADQQRQRPQSAQPEQRAQPAQPSQQAQRRQTQPQDKGREHEDGERGRDRR